MHPQSVIVRMPRQTEFLYTLVSEDQIVLFGKWKPRFEKQSILKY